jgi:hypothetical protein
MDADHQGHSEYIAFLDECGDHSLTKIDQDFPLFVLSLILVKRRDYAEKIIHEINQLKLRYWDHEGVNLHSREIRKKTGPFQTLQNPILASKFMDEISFLMDQLPYELFIVGIRKDRLCQKYVYAANPYELALMFVMERLVHGLETRRQSALPLIAEARGENEDNHLKAAFYSLVSKGTDYVDQNRFRKIEFPLLFHDKRKNIAGIQLADLCAYPSARHILKPQQPNRAYEIIRRHLYRGTHGVRGWKEFP